MKSSLVTKTAIGTIALLFTGFVAHLFSGQQQSPQVTVNTTRKHQSPLPTALPMAFVPTSHPEAAKKFYSETLGLGLVADDSFALIYKLAGDQTLRVQRVKELTPHPFTTFGWQVNDIESATKDLVSRGVKFERFSFMKQDDLGICTFDNGDRVAWFKDPDGNTLSIAQLKK